MKRCNSVNSHEKQVVQAQANRLPRIVTCLALVGLINGCMGETVYTHVQTEDGLGMKPPIRFTVRIRVDTANKVVTWMQDAEDARGVTDRLIRTYGESASSACDVFDDQNWTCEIRGVDGKTLERPEMNDGALSRFYWTDTEHYRKRHRVFKHVF